MTGLPTNPAPTILVVDDRAINRDFLVSLLSLSGYRTLEANSPTEIPQVDRIDLIITDVHMPGMNGLNFLERVRADSITSEVPVILYTAGYKTPDIEARAKAMGAFAVLTKPTAPEVILENVRAALQAKNRETAAVDADIRAAKLNYRSAALIEIMLDLAGERNPEQLVRTFCNGAKALINVQEASLHILAPGESNSHFVFSTSESSNSYEGAGLAMCNCGVIDISTEANGQCFRNASGARLGSAGDSGPSLFVPVTTSANHVGCFCLVRKLGERDFDQEDQRLVVTLTSELAFVYENIRMYRELEQFSVRVSLEVEERKRAQDLLERSRQESAKLKNEFFSHVSHELRSPIMVVQQFLEILTDGIGGEIKPLQREYLDVALRNTHQLNAMINDLLEATRMESAKLRVDVRTMPLLPVLNEALTSALPSAWKKHIALCSDSPDALPLVTADRSRVLQIVTNLLDNAIKFTPENGSVSLRATVSDDDPRFVRVDISDTGRGIAPEERSRIFNRLYQVPNSDSAARKGLGLGLCICRELVTLQGGEIRVKSQPNSGSTFSFTLPVFSVANLVESFLGQSAMPVSLAVLAIELGDLDPLSHKQEVVALREIIERCVMPGLDTVLPGTYGTGRGQKFVVLARTHHHGGELIARRIEEQITGNAQALGSRYRPVVRLEMIDLATPENLGPGEERAAVASRIEQRLKEILVD